MLTTYYAKLKNQIDSDNLCLYLNSKLPSEFGFQILEKYNVCDMSTFYKLK